jgi:hypothetical protein
MIEGDASGVTNRCHDVTFPLSSHHRKYRVHFSTGFIRKKTLSISVSYRFPYEKTDEISRTLRLMHDGISFDENLHKQVGYFGTRIN